jgi:hypothetical protein
VANHDVMLDHVVGLLRVGDGTCNYASGKAASEAASKAVKSASLGGRGRQHEAGKRSSNKYPFHRTDSL